MRDMRHFIVARSRSGWGVAVESDLLAEFPEAAQALDHAKDLAGEADVRGEESSVIDLSEADIDMPMLIGIEPKLH
jgi:hypothetical protein